MKSHAQQNWYCWYLGFCWCCSICNDFHAAYNTVAAVAATALLAVFLSVHLHWKEYTFLQFSLTSIWQKGKAKLLFFTHIKQLQVSFLCHITWLHGSSLYQVVLTNLTMIPLVLLISGYIYTMSAVSSWFQAMQALNNKMKCVNNNFTPCLRAFRRFPLSVFQQNNKSQKDYFLIPEAWSCTRGALYSKIMSMLRVNIWGGWYTPLGRFLAHCLYNMQWRVK